MENNNKSDWSKRDVGALWKRESSTQKYLSGYVKVDELGIERELKVVVFSNKNKKDNPKAPDYRIYLSLPKESASTSVAAGIENQKEYTKTTSPKQKKPVVASSNEAESEEDVL